MYNGGQFDANNLDSRNCFLMTQICLGEIRVGFKPNVVVVKLFNLTLVSFSSLLENKSKSLKNLPSCLTNEAIEFEPHKNVTIFVHSLYGFGSCLST